MVSIEILFFILYLLLQYFVSIRNISMFTNTWLSKRMVSCIFDYIFVFNMILWYITEANKKIIYKRQMHLILVWEYIHLSYQERLRKYVFSIVMLKKGNDIQRSKLWQQWFRRGLWPTTLSLSAFYVIW